MLTAQGGKKLNRIQKNNNLNEVFVMDKANIINNGHHFYSIHMRTIGIDLLFQDGPRNVEGSTRGILDTDLLEIVRHRLQSFQDGPYATRENAMALTHLEETLLWLNKRVEDRVEKTTLGTNKI